MRPGEEVIQGNIQLHHAKGKTFNLPFQYLNYILILARCRIMCHKLLLNRITTVNDLVKIDSDPFYLSQYTDNL